jgi:hypothetical protein
MEVGMDKPVVIEDEDGNPVELPMHFEVCGRCEGRGVHDHPAFSNGITSSEWADDFDEEGRADYLAGRYDVACEACHGVRVLLVPDEDRMSPSVLALWNAHCEAEWEYAQEVAAERRMGC